MLGYILSAGTLYPIFAAVEYGLCLPSLAVTLYALFPQLIGPLLGLS